MADVNKLAPFILKWEGGFANNTHQMVYKVVEKGKFEYVEDSFQPLS